MAPVVPKPYIKPKTFACDAHSQEPAKFFCLSVFMCDRCYSKTNHSAHTT